MTHGYRKDKRPDLKQFVLSMLCVDANVPILGKIEDGNASDKTINHRQLGEISGHLRQHGIAEQHESVAKRRQIEALYLILLIALLIWRLMERVMRMKLNTRQTTVPGWDNKPTARPTAYMVTWKFRGNLILCIGANAAWPGH